MTLIKICGITSPAEACAAVEAGADAIGVVFASSPRQVTVAQARRIVANLPPRVAAVGVFVNAPKEQVQRTFREVGLDAVQLHGDETLRQCRELASALRAVPCETAHRPAAMGFFSRRAEHARDADETPWGRVIRRVRVEPTDDAAALAARAAEYDEFTRLLDPGAGRGLTFDWRIAAGLPGRVAIAGGLRPENVATVIRTLHPFAVDVSSGVESAPGRKDAGRLFAFVEAVRSAHADLLA